ncbi:MAG: alanine dehydrogenase, partial [Methylococcales bacterium]|nr:alanine dehydrogenase [Methylococcales bacterium]
MKIGIPTEIKILEGRVALVPEAVKELVKLNHQVFIQQGAGKLSGYNDQAYQIAGATIVKNAETLYGESGLIVKVKEPLPAEFDFLRQDHILFSYLHLAAELNLMKHLLAVGITAIAFETVEVNGALPLLTPMSDIAGRLSIQIGTHLLHAPQGGKGILLGGLPAAKRGNVVVLGAGVAGGNAASVAAALGSNVTVFDKKHDKLTEMRMLGPNVTALHPYSQSIEEAVQQADLLIGAVLIPGAPAPVLVTKEMVSTMEPGSVIIDIAVDQGGC